MPEDVVVNVAVARGHAGVVVACGSSPLRNAESRPHRYLHRNCRHTIACDALDPCQSNVGQLQTGQGSLAHRPCNAYRPICAPQSRCRRGAGNLVTNSSRGGGRVCMYGNLAHRAALVLCTVALLAGLFWIMVRLGQPPTHQNSECVALYRGARSARESLTVDAYALSVSRTGPVWTCGSERAYLAHRRRETGIVRRDEPHGRE